MIFFAYYTFWYLFLYLLLINRATVAILHSFWNSLFLFSGTSNPETAIKILSSFLTSFFKKSNNFSKRVWELKVTYDEFLSHALRVSCGIQDSTNGSKIVAHFSVVTPKIWSCVSSLSKISVSLGLLIILLTLSCLMKYFTKI